MTWYFVGATLISALFVLNAAFVFFLRSWRPGSSPAPAPLLKRSQSGFEITMALVLTAALTTCFGARFVAPGSALALAMSTPWAIACLIPWMMGIGAVYVIVATQLRRRRPARPVEPSRR
ncbi:MAG: hypothetical protein ABIR54_24405 [Burkholderiaceae bacterium]